MAATGAGGMDDKSFNVAKNPFISDSIEPVYSNKVRTTSERLSLMSRDVYCMRYARHLFRSKLGGKLSTILDRTRNSEASVLILVRTSNCRCRNAVTVFDINVANKILMDGTTIPLMAGVII